MSDIIVDEVRKIRNAHSQSFNYDVKAICDYYQTNHKRLVNKLKNLKTNDKSKNSNVTIEQSLAYK